MDRQRGGAVVGGEWLSDRVTRIVAPNPSPVTLSGTNSYVVGEDSVVVVDPGPDLAEHVEALVAAIAARGRLVLSLVTHRHSDHLPAAVRLRERLGAPIVGHRDLPQVDQALEHGELITVGAIPRRALATPGHTPEHVCYFLEQEQALFTGDLILGAGSVVVGDGRGDLAVYMDSLRLVGRLGARRIFPGHGPVVEDPAEKVREYVEHRDLRERQILAALEAGAQTVRAIVERLYVEVPAALHNSAARNVRAHLYKLEREGRVVAAGDLWRLMRMLGP